MVNKKKFIICLSIVIPIILFGLISIGHSESAAYPIYDFTGGLYTNDQPDRLDLRYSPDLLNVWLDRDTGIVKRFGYLHYLYSALPEGQPIRKMFEFRKNNGNKYIIFESSGTIYSSPGTGGTNVIVSGQDMTATDSYTTALDSLLRDNGITSGYWDASTYTPYTVTNSTSMVYGKYSVYYKDHWFKAGVTNYPSVLYWSVVNVPGDFGSYGSGSKFVGKDDGDVITALCPLADRLLIFKKYSVYALTGSDPTTWLIRPINIGIGCLYGSSIAMYKGIYPMWLSHRGIELYDGTQFNLVSLPIDNYMRSLRQLNVGLNSIIYDTAADWGHGTGINIDTTTIEGSVLMAGDTPPYSVTQSNQSDWSNASYSTYTMLPYLAPARQTDISTSSGDVVLGSGGKDYAYQTNVGVTNNPAFSAYAVDEDTTTAYLSASSWQGEVNVIPDLGSVQRIYKITSVAVAGAVDVAMDLYISTNNSNWIMLNHLDVSGYAGQYIFSTFNSTAGINCRYIRLAFEKGVNTGTDAVYDFRAYHLCSTGSITTQTLDFGSTPALYPYLYATYYNTSTITDADRTIMTSYSDAYTAGIDFMTRTSTDGATWESWQSAISSEPTTSTRNRYMQVTAYLHSTNDYWTPVLSNITLTVPEGASYTTAITTATGWGSWGGFNGSSSNGSSSISYYVQTSTANDNQSTRPYIPVVNNGYVNSSVGPYIWITSTFTRTNSTDNPILDRLQVSYYTNNYQEPFAMSYRDGYWLSVSTGDGSTINDTVIHYDKFGRFTLHNDMNILSGCLYNNNPFFGASDNSGQIYQHDINGLYSDDGKAYKSYYTTKIMDIGFLSQQIYSGGGNSGMSVGSVGYLTQQKAFDYLYFQAKNSGGYLYNKFRVDGSTGDYTSIDNIDLNTPTLVNQKVRFPTNTISNYLQLRFGNDTINQGFSIRGLNLIYDVYPLQ